ncbi:hypothetical protein [Streptomyces canus]|uniref:hypothetical protein n=1 Tax=Streptomyces canus TaxID=58343 RepID=UPI003F4B445C
MEREARRQHPAGGRHQLGAVVEHRRGQAERLGEPEIAAAGLGVQQLLAAGVPTTQAVVVSIADTGKLVNFDPVVDLVLQPSGAADRVALQTIVSKLRIPRVGDQVLLIADPDRPGGYLYAGDGVAP